MTQQEAVSPAPLPGRRQLIDQAEDLPLVLERLASVSVLGVDVEAGIPPRERHSRFALLQIATGDYTVAIDPLRLRDLSSLGPIMDSERIVKVFHGIALDRDMLESAGLQLHCVCDLSEVARSAYGKGEASLSALSRRAFGIGMDKSLQRSDWLHRPLSLPLLAYAWRDAELTLGLYHWASRMHPELVKLHTLLSPRPEVPEGVAPWLRTVLTGSRQPIYDVLLQAGVDVDADTQGVLDAVNYALETISDPRLRARALRVAGDLDLYELVPLLVKSLHAVAAPERAAAARALATMGEQSAEPAIRAMLDDPTQEVRDAAAMSLELLPLRAPPEELEGKDADPVMHGDPPIGA
jgi:hypothetical protein